MPEIGAHRPDPFPSNSLGEYGLWYRLAQQALELGMGISSSGGLYIGQRPRAKHPPDFYTCPGCKGAVYSTTRDLYGNALYDCPKCHRPFDLRALEHNYRRYHPANRAPSTTQSRKLRKTMGGQAYE